MKQNEILTLSEMEKTGNKWAVVKVNETFYWKTDIIKKAKKIECVYLVNLSEPTHCCELSVSYPTVSLRNVFEDTTHFTDDELFANEMDGTLNDWQYWNENVKAELIKYYADESEDEVIENEAANPCYC